MICISDLEEIAKIRNNRKLWKNTLVFIGKILNNDRGKVLSNLELLIKTKNIISLINTLDYYIIKFLSQKYDKEMILDLGFIFNCGFDNSTVNTENPTKEQSLLLVISSLVQMIPSLGSLFLVEGGDISNFYSINNNLISKLNVYINMSKRYYINDSILYLPGDISELNPDNFIEHSCYFIDRNYLNLMRCMAISSINENATIESFSAKKLNSMIINKYVKLLDHLNVKYVVYRNNINVEFGYATKINGIQVISISGKSDLGYCYYRDDINTLNGCDFLGNNFEYSCRYDVGTNQKFKTVGANKFFFSHKSGGLEYWFTFIDGNPQVYKVKNQDELQIIAFNHMEEPFTFEDILDEKNQDDIHLTPTDYQEYENNEQQNYDEQQNYNEQQNYDEQQNYEN